MLRTPLPIDALQPQLNAVLREQRHFMLQAPTGSGKSTRIPQFLLESEHMPPRGSIVVLQPRRLPARLLAHRVAEEMQVALGDTVGYAMRFESRRSAATRILFVTEGYFLRMLQGNPDLNGVAAVLFDEFHERHLEGDLCLGRVKVALAQGWSGRVGIMSATLTDTALHSYWPDMATLRAEGRSYPVTIHHLNTPPTRQPLWEATEIAIKSALKAGAQADILVFLPGKRELQRTAQTLAACGYLRDWEILQLHGELPIEQQRRIVAENNAAASSRRPRILLATNVAETSVTIPDIRTVIDSGWARVPAFDPRRGINTLLTERISLANADQRAGRAGRVAPGQCFRMWSQRDQERLPASLAPEIQRLDLAGLRLNLASTGCGDNFPWLEPPPPQSWQQAGDLLEWLGAVNQGQLTPMGQTMALFPMHPRQSRVLYAAHQEGVLPWIIPALAILDTRGIVLPLNNREDARTRDEWLAPADGHSDLLREVFAYHTAAAARFEPDFCHRYGLHRNAAYEVHQAVQQLTRQCRDLNWDVETLLEDFEAFAKALLSGYADQIGRQVDRATLRYRRIGDKTGLLRRDSVVHNAELILSMDSLEQEVAGKLTVMLGMNTAIQETWLQSVHPDLYSARSEAVLQTETRRVEQCEIVTFMGLVLREKWLEQPAPEVAARLLADALLEGRWPLKQWDQSVESWICRLNTLAHWCPELEISPITEADRGFLLQQLCHGAFSYKQVKDRDIRPILHQWVPESILPLIDEWTPTRFTCTNGKSVKLRYEAPDKVVLSAKIQQLYDVPGHSLRICNGRCPLVIELLAPNQRPVQTTTDLDGFWTGAYPQIRKDLFGRYPRHEWR